MNTQEMKEFMYNPSTFNDSFGNNFVDVDVLGKVVRAKHFVGTDHRTMQLPIFLYSTNGDATPVSEFLDFLEGFIPTEDFTPPPIMRIAFGAGYVKDFVLQQGQRTFKDFNKDLQPTAVDVNLSLVEV